MADLEALPSESLLPVTQSAAGRGDRLNPWRGSRLYWHLTTLKREFEIVISEYLANMDIQTLLDYGCGNMPYRPLFSPHVSSYIGCDLPGNELADSIMRGPNQLQQKSKSVDVVLSSQVLEHVEDPISYLQEARRVLQDNGIIILSTHGVWRYHPDPCDFWRWTSEGLRKIVESGGFTILRFRGLMGPEATALQLLQDAKVMRIPACFRNLFTRYMQWKIRRADLKCPDAVRDREACVFSVVAVPTVS